MGETQTLIRTSTPARIGYRTDLQWIRGVAVLIVVAYHAGVPGFAGGFIGVDTFFVLSGYLITRLLVAEFETTGRIEVGSFLQRRIRRLLPAGSLVLLATTLGWVLVSTTIERTEQAAVAVGAALFSANVALTIQGRDYLNAGTTGSPFEHWWSLGVEEQFYLVWPTIVLGLLVAGRRRSGADHDGSDRRWVLVGTLALTLASFGLGLASTGSDPVGAYLLLHTRAWQLLAGAALAIAAVRPTPRTRVTLGMAGVVLLAAALLTIDDLTPYPGVMAVLPTVAALALITGGIGTDGRVPTFARHRALRRPLKALEWTGDRSYSIYLWHWPLLVLWARWSEGPSGSIESLGWFARTCLIAVALLASEASFRLVEDPVRRSARLRTSSTATWILGASLVAITATTAVWATRPPALASDGLATQVTGASELLGEGPLPEPVASDDLLAVSSALVGRDAPDRGGCVVEVEDDTPAPVDACLFGDASGTGLVVLLGDSHAEMWLPALDRWGRDEGRPVLLLTKQSCSPYLEAPVRWDGLPFPQCEGWREAAGEVLRSLDVEQLVIAGAAASASYDGVEPADMAAAIPSAIDRWAAFVPDTPVLLIGAIPAVGEVPICLQEHGPATDNCDGTVNETVLRAEQAAVDARPRVTLMETSRLLCDDDGCPAVIGNIIVYRDRSHLSATMARELAPAFAPHLSPPD